MINRFDIQPFVGALPIRFGMSRDDVHSLLGTPDVSHQQWDDGGRLDFGLVDHWHGCRLNVGYNKRGTATRVGFCPGGCEVGLMGRLLWSREEQPDPNEELLRHDAAPMDFLGSLVFLALGVSTSGYHDDYPEGRALTVEPDGAWDSFRENARPASLEKYGL